MTQVWPSATLCGQHFVSSFFLPLWEPNVLRTHFNENWSKHLMINLLRYFLFVMHHAQKVCEILWSKPLSCAVRAAGQCPYPFYTVLVCGSHANITHGPPLIGSPADRQHRFCPADYLVEPVLEQHIVSCLSNQVNLTAVSRWDTL